MLSCFFKGNFDKWEGGNLGYETGLVRQISPLHVGGVRQFLIELLSI